MDWNEVVKTGLTAVGSGGAAFGGAFLRFKQRLQQAEDNARAGLELAQLLRAELTTYRAAQDHVAAGWRLEFASLRDDFQRDLDHREELERAREEGRASRRDPAEDLRHELHELKTQLERMKERQARYVRSDTFVQHVKEQETQWKELARTMGRLDVLAKER